MKSNQPFPSDLAEKFMLRLPVGMRERIAQAARSNNRSMNSEIVKVLEATFPPFGADDSEISTENWRETEVDRILTEIERLFGRLKEVRSLKWPGEQ
jgi:hypothetical protein